MALNETLIAKGCPYPTGAVIEQGNSTGANGTKHEQALLDAGMPATTIKDLIEATNTVFQARGTQHESRGESKNATADEAAARQEGKIVGRRLKNGARVILYDGPVAGIRYEQFKLGEIGGTTKDVLDYMAKQRPLVVPLDDKYKELFKGRSAAAMLDDSANNLKALAGTQDVKRKSAPQDTLALYEAHGKVVDLVERINNYARLAFEDEPTIRALFNKDILVRARRGSKKSTIVQPAETETVETQND